MDEKKIRVGVIFGGRSAEHEISLLSAKNIINALDKTKYDPVLISIDKQGEWHVQGEEQYLLNAHNPKQVALYNAEHRVALVAEKKNPSLVSLSSKKVTGRLDVVFPILHGTYGEDGAIQGLLKMAGIPFVGAGILGSSIGMDKDVMKRLLRDAKLNIAKFFCFTRKTVLPFDQVVKELKLPFFVKPANLGSSVGVTKVKSQEDYVSALEEAFLYDHKILIEEFIEGREIELCVLGNEEPIVSLPGEVVVHDEFYTYDAKYMGDGGAVFELPAQVDAQTCLCLQKVALETFKALCCEGFARIDLFLKKNGDIYVNEINTIPGCTGTSMFPQLWKASGLELSQVVDRLITLALEKSACEKALKTTFG